MFNLKEFLRNNQYRLTLGDPEDMSDGFELVEDVIYPDIDQIRSVVFEPIDGVQMQTLLMWKIGNIFNYCYMFRCHVNDADGNVGDFQWHTLEWCDTMENNSGPINNPTEVVVSITKKEFQTKYIDHYENTYGVSWFCSFINSLIPTGFDLRTYEVCEQFVKAAPHCFDSSVLSCGKYPHMFITCGMRYEYRTDKMSRMTLLDQIPDDHVFEFIGHAH